MLLLPAMHNSTPIIAQLLSVVIALATSPAHAQPPAPPPPAAGLGSETPPPPPMTAEVAPHAAPAEATEAASPRAAAPANPATASQPTPGAESPPPAASPAPDGGAGAPTQPALPEQGIPAEAAGGPPAPARDGASLATHARVHFVSTYPHSSLESQDVLGLGDWRHECDAPCGTPVAAEGRRVRVVADGMTATNPFVVEPGQGTARFRVKGGSAAARDAGVLGLLVGIPVAMAGMVLLGVGTSNSSQRGLRVPGLVTLGTGGAGILVSLPLLVIGSSSVRDSKGTTIALAELEPRF